MDKNEIIFCLKSTRTCDEFSKHGERNWRFNSFKKN